MLCLLQGLRADGGHGRRRRDRVGIDFDVEDRGQAGSERAFVCGQELGRFFNCFAVAAEGAGISGEVGRSEVRDE